MSSNGLLRRRLTLVVLVMAGALLVSWLLDAEASPLNGYFVWHPALANAWTTLNLPAVKLGFAFSRAVHLRSSIGYGLGLAAQWGLLAFVASLLLMRAPRGRASRASAASKRSKTRGGR